MLKLSLRLEVSLSQIATVVQTIAAIWSLFQ